MDILEFEMHRLRSLRAMQAGLLELKLMRDIARLEIAIRRHGSALKAGYRPDQPRVPRGQRDGGQWVDDGGSSGRIVLAGDAPTNDTPEVPKERPPKSDDRTRSKKVVARWLDEIGVSIDTAFALGKVSAWLQTYSAEVESYRDPPKSLEDLQQAASTPRPGYDVHHIVERNQEYKFSKELIYSRENEVLVPRLKHQEINSWYQTKNPAYGGESPRDYLNGRSWAVQRGVGLEALREKGVLKP
jgi:hypothetical protein